MKKAITIISTVVLLITFTIVILFTATRMMGKTPEIFGYQIFRISSESMVPRLQVGDIILSKRVDDITTIKLGDVITYEGTFGTYAGKNITHEVTREPYEAAGNYYLQTMGIANHYPDPEITGEQVIGKMIRVMPVLSAVYNFFRTPLGLVVILGFLALLFINESMNLVRLIKANKETECLACESDNISKDQIPDNTTDDASSDINDNLQE